MTTVQLTRISSVSTPRTRSTWICRSGFDFGGVRKSKKGALLVKAKKMTLSDELLKNEGAGEEEEDPPLIDVGINSRPRRIALFVEPSPFA